MSEVNVLAVMDSLPEFLQESCHPSRHVALGNVREVRAAVAVLIEAALEVSLGVGGEDATERAKLNALGAAIASCTA